MKQTVYILDRFAEENPLYTSWLSDSSFQTSHFRCEVVKAAVESWNPPEDAALIITHQHYQWETISALRRIYQQDKVPILILCDGILEFRNTWQNPTVADGSLFQPLFGHKLACLGRGPARAIEALGNVGRCEIVGHPKFDQIYDSEHLPVQTNGAFRVLITTARTPAFNETQRQSVIEGLKAIQKRANKNPFVGQRPLEVTWRLPSDFADDLQLPPADDFISISDAIELSDAVITTPSTIYLESVIKRRPTAILDFTNSPAYLASAWNISATMHVNSVLEELADPPAAKMQFQRFTLHENLEVGANSRQRLFALMKHMISVGNAARANNLPLAFAPRILSDPQRGIAKVETEFDLQSLYPDSVVYESNNVAMLRQELAQAIARLGQLPQELHEKNQMLDAKGVHIKSMEKELHSAEQRIGEGHQRESNLAHTIEQKQEDLRRKSAHIEFLSSKWQDSKDEVERLSQHTQDVKEYFAEQVQSIMRWVPELKQPKRECIPAVPAKPSDSRFPKAA